MCAIVFSVRNVDKGPVHHDAAVGLVDEMGTVCLCVVVGVRVLCAPVFSERNVNIEPVHHNAAVRFVDEVLLNCGSSQCACKLKWQRSLRCVLANCIKQLCASPFQSCSCRGCPSCTHTYIHRHPSAPTCQNVMPLGHTYRTHESACAPHAPARDVVEVWRLSLPVLQLPRVRHQPHVHVVVLRKALDLSQHLRHKLGLGHMARAAVVQLQVCGCVFEMITARSA